MLEKRVFLIDIDNITDDKLDFALKSDKEFMSIAEKQGNVYSLEGYQKAFNFNAEEINSSTQYIRILDVEVNLPIDELTCPHCKTKGEPCDFPDLYYDGCGDDFEDEDEETQELYNEQAKLQLELQQLGYNIVTCGNCGDVFIHRT